MGDGGKPPTEPTRAFGTTPGPQATRAFQARPPAESAGPPEVGSTLDDFLLMDRLGQGAFATVYLAHQNSMRRTVALKVSETEDAEAQTLAQLDHPGIVRVYDQRDLPAQGVHIVYMEYLPGGTLEEAVRRARDGPPTARSGRLLLDVVDEALASRSVTPPTDSQLRDAYAAASWPETVCRIGAQLAEALDYAHGQGVLHRDVKPGNVLLGANGRARLADFNVSSAAAVADTNDPDESLGGSIAYMPPEQLEACSETHPRRAADLDGRSDLYALGVLLWELLTGRRPLPEQPGAQDEEGGDLLEALARARRRPTAVPSGTELPPDTPRLLAETLGACLAPDPANRPPTGRNLARRLQICLDPRARELLVPPTRGWRPWARRFPVTAVLAVAMVPNVLLSVLNILWNLQVAAGGQWEEFQDQVSVINAVMYTIGIGLCVRWLWPLIQSTRRRRRGETLTAEDRSRVRLKTVVLGDRLAVLIAVLWAISGVVFVVWEAAQQGGQVSSEVTFSFIVSLALFGILAATQCFFGDNHVLAAALLPELVRPGDEDVASARAFERLATRTWIYFAACTAVPFLSIITLALMPLGNQLAFLSLGVLGMAGFGMTIWLGVEIRRDLEALARALR